MSAVRAPIHVPMFAAEAGEWMRVFVDGLRYEVVEPLFASPDPAAFQAALPEALDRGAALRFRWLASLADLPSKQRDALRNEWLRPPPPAALDELQIQASEVLGDARSFVVRRALGMTFTDAPGDLAVIVERWADNRRAAQWLVELARLAQPVAALDVLAIGWMMVLDGTVPAPDQEVAHEAATALLHAASAQASAVQDVFDEAARASAAPFDIGVLPGEWLAAHPTLIGTLFLLLGFALDEVSVVGVSLRTRQDPEDAGLSTLALLLDVSGPDSSDAELRIQEHALRAGVFSMTSDARGGLIALSISEI